MSENMERIERLIVRRLDGELTPDEGVELDRALLRNPDARPLWEAYERIDKLAASALRGALIDNTPDEHDVTPLAHVPPLSTVARRPKHHAAWWLMPGAVAAALAAFVLMRSMPPPSSTNHGAMVHRTQVPVPIIDKDTPRHSKGARTIPVSDWRPARRIKRNLDRGVYGVIDKDGRIYWIEVDRTRTLRRGDPRAIVRQVNSDM